MSQLIKRIKRLYKVYILMVDLILIFASYVLVFYVRYRSLPAFNFTPFLNATPYILIASVIYIDLYKILSFFRKTIYDVLKSIALMVSLLGVTTISVTYMLQGFSFPRLILVITPLVQFILLGTFHITLLFIKHRFSGEKTIMIVCLNRSDTNEIVKKIDTFMKGEKVAKKLLLDMSQERIILKRLKDMDEIYLSADIPPEYKAKIIRECMGGRQVIYVVPHLFEISLINAKVVHLEDTPAFMVDTLGLTTEQAFVKRMFDIIVSFVGLVLLSPLMLITAILIKLTSSGPVLYKQERITKGNKRFYVIKFRTMKQNAEDITGPILSQVNDPRVTPIGRILRRTRIDELPQLINVLKGDMSLVGPRPERPFFVEQFMHDLPEYEHRFAVKAGITGYAQIAGNYGTSAEDKLRYDLMYIRHYSLLLDIKLIFRTIGVLFTPGSAYIKDPENLKENEVNHQTAKTAKNQVI